MKNLVITFALVLLTGTAFSRSMDVYKYEVSFNKLKFDTRFFSSDDTFGVLTARAMRKIPQFTNDCIELMEMAGSIQTIMGDEIEMTGGLELLSNYNIDPKELEGAVAGQCRYELDIDKSEDNCKVTVTKRKISLDTAYLGFRLKPTPESVYINYLKKITKKLPMMSYGCITGWNSDSWENSAANPAGRQYLEEMGFNRKYLENGYGIYIQDESLDQGYFKIFDFGLVQK